MIRRFRSRRWVGIEKQARRMLDSAVSAASLNDLRSPPGNRLEALAGNRKGQHGIRIDARWRICFVWTSEGPSESEVEIVDYH